MPDPLPKQVRKVAKKDKNPNVPFEPYAITKPTTKSSSFQMKYTKSSFPYGVSPMKDRTVGEVAGDLYEGFKGFAEGSKYSLTKGVRRGIDRYKKSKASRTPAGNMKVYGKSGGVTEK